MRLFYITLLGVLLCFELSGQSDCVEGRYTTILFPDVTKSTVQYGKNININTTDSLDLLMDIYTPNGDAEPNRPVMILAHGGSFLAGNRADLATLCIQYAQQGYVTASVSYHLWPLTSGFPDSLELIDVVVKAVGDIKGAVRYFKADQAGSNLWKVDSTRIIIGGYSAGAIAALHASHMDSTDVNLPTFIKASIDANGGIEGQANKLTNTSDVLATVNLSGALYDRNFIDVEDPPFISYHGNADGTVAFRRALAAGIITMEGSALLHEQANLLGITNRLDSVDGGGHTDIYVTNGQYAENLSDFFVHANNFLGNQVCPELISSTKNDLLLKDILVYPNPVVDVINISFEKPLSEIILSLYNMNGQLIYRGKYHNQNSIQLDVPNLSEGMYSIFLNSPGEGIFSQMLFVGDN